MKKLSIILTIFIFINSILPSIAAEKKAKDEPMNVCFMTLNSSEEKEVFKKQLSNGANKGKFKFHEFVPTGSDQSEDWFNRACEKKITCDILAISGHFGGSFFGKSGQSLKISELETRSCKKDCEEIMNAPKEVFLFGCSTLAGKDGDTRTPDQYFDDLVNDGIGAGDAAHIVEQRYGSVGTSFRDTMRRAFQSVPHLYGFSSIAPSGASVKQHLIKYFEKIPNYYDHLMQVEVERTIALMNNFSKWGTKNKEISDALSVTNFDQCSALLLGSSDDPMNEVLQNICRLRVGFSPAKVGIDFSLELLGRSDFALYLPTISEFLGNYNLKKEFAKKMDQSPQIKERLLASLDKSTTTFGKLQIAKILLSFSVIGEGDYKKIEKAALLSYLTPPVSTATKDAICSYETPEAENNRRGYQPAYLDVSLDVSLNELDEKLFSDLNGLFAMTCLKFSNPEVLDKLKEVAQTGKSSDQKAAAMTVYIMSGNKKDDLKLFLDERFTNSKSKIEQQTALWGLITHGFNDASYLNAIEKLLKSKDTIKYFDYLKSEYSHGLLLIGAAKFKSLDQVNYYFDLIKKNAPKSGDDKAWADYFSKGILADTLPIEEAVKFLDDKKTTDEDRQRYFESAFGNGYNYATQEKNIKMPLFLLPRFFKVMLGRDASGNVNSLNSIDSIENVEINSAEDEAKFIEIVEAASLEDFSPNTVIEYLPQGFNGDAFAKFVIKHYTKYFGYDSESDYDNISKYLIKRESLNEKEKQLFKEFLTTHSDVVESTKAELARLGVE
ncbi:MAG: hypothetical protein A2504_12340 [Bdellovibrionales bacterium RIFOXYD12_FULL_39_22]|nr:MAG: hypothetical protein A2385_09345 [Bdellovibrionales bacterium RIFOXYB1_FULL_39_21]OFZ44973.1 MAG: hypothetical protein A2485_14390 [Bdellovibrionales bacterium RIFOXYC12_FULL_39_17]OFZ49152.1 MAG: hypothetical protein A2404_07890 [Bdellovibrionales bacterium RIFOXYC1_FULL_39_130]OFZ74632.1 MAG: hypothetical protein A2451_08555 [Bdellovibrionales bacterium RIFOXYC2_FULL_39_8]OFZ76959.1 MAG: hypothetical protein A2560_03945 [Bdellovibrionales bacterium RIFOXYD1_FULL_39_84]OFZ96149.1 MAG: